MSAPLSPPSPLPGASTAPAGQASGAPGQSGQQDQADALAALVAGLAGRPAPPVRIQAISPDLLLSGTLCLCLRQGGRCLLRLWQDDPDLVTALQASLAQARARLGQGLAQADLAELFVQQGAPRPFTPDMAERPAANRLRHRHGLALADGPRIARLAPTEQTTRNLSPARAFEHLAAALTLPAGSGQALILPGQSWLLDLTAPRGHPVLRGQPVIAQADITPASLRAMADQMTGWLCRQVGPDGRTTYKYWPSNGSYSQANNTIRQFMGSAALALACRRSADPALHAACRRNFRYNFATFYETRDRFAVINEFGKTKLGAAAVAIMAILNLPDPRPWQTQLGMLRAFLLAMQQADGSFRTFLDPPDRNDNQFFYPGEALLALVMLHGQDPDPALLARIRKGFLFYRAFFRNDRNPAFVPWHTQALCLLHDQTGQADLADFVFEMNDWLLPLQDRSTDPPDITGDFFDPDRPDYGPPHASATGVYLEGLIEAWRLARSLGHSQRACAYRRALLSGVRMLRQLQFRDGLDMFYITRRDRVAGGLRTAVHDNTIRIDNVQHGLMAIWRILDRFGPQDYAP